MSTDLAQLLTPLLKNPARFQQLTEADREIYGAPAIVHLEPPPSSDIMAAEKRQRWLEWRGAPYPAKRHSEYVFRAPQDFRSGPRILLSAVLDVSDGLDKYLAGFNKRQRYKVTGRKASNLGYVARPIRPAEHSAEIHAIIHSSKERQGRPIAAPFDERPVDHGFPNYAEFSDPAYADICVGVFAPEGGLAAYLLGKRVGHHVQYDEIMGHTDHLAHEVMDLLHYAFLQRCLEQEIVPTCLNYGPWYSGRDPYSPASGLNFWKRKFRFRPAYLITASS